MKRAVVLGLGVVCLLAPLVFAGQESTKEKEEKKEKKSKLDLTQRYLLLETVRVSTMQKELQEAAAAGYRVRMGVGRTVLLLEKVAPGSDLYEHRLPRTSEKELNEAGAQGFRVLPFTLGMLKGQAEAIMERAPDSHDRWEYRILDATRVSTLQKELGQASHEGFEVVALTRSAPFGAASGERVVVVERRAGGAETAAIAGAEQPAGDTGEHYLLLDTNKTSTMQEEISEAAARGYRILDGSDAQLTMLLEKIPAGGEVPEYLLLATTKTSTLEKEINEAAAKGYRLLPQTLGAIEKRPLGGFLGGSYQTEIIAVMEKAPAGSQRSQYQLLATKRDSTMQKELTQANQQGFEIVAMTLSYQGEYIVILEKPGT